MARLLDLEGAISHLTLQDSANSLFEKEISERSIPKAVKSEDSVEKSGVLDGFLLCERAAAELPEHVFHAKVSGYDISEVVEEDLMYFTSLTSIDLSDNNINQMQPMRHFPVLRELNIACNDLSSLGLSSQPRVELEFQALKILDISYNNINSEDMDALAKLPKLEKLDVSFNGLRRLSNITWNHSNALNTNVAHESVSSDVSSQFSVYFPSLRVLNAESNKLRGDCMVALSHTKRLEEVRLAYNLISHIPDFGSEFSYSNLAGLRRLDLSHNKISDEGKLNNLSIIPDLVILLEGNMCLVETLGRSRTEKGRSGRLPAKSPGQNGTKKRVAKDRFTFTQKTSSQVGNPSISVKQLVALSAANSDENSFDGQAKFFTQPRNSKREPRPFAPMPDDGWRQGLLPEDAAGIGGVLGLTPHEKIDLAFRRIEGEVRERRTSELLSGMKKFAEAEGFIIEEGEEGEEEDSDESDSLEEEATSEASLQQEASKIPTQNDIFESDVEEDSDYILQEYDDDSAHDESHDRKWLEIKSSTQSAVNALRVFLSRSTMLEEPITQPRYRSMTKCRMKQMEAKKSNEPPPLPRSAPSRRDAAKMEKMLHSMKNRLDVVDNTLTDTAL